MQSFPGLREVLAVDPIWSDDGTRLAFSVVNKEVDAVEIAVMDVKSGTWQKVTQNLRPEVASESIFLDSWGPDAQSILFHALRAAYEVRTDGQKSPARKMLLSQPFAVGEISSASRFSMSGDRKFLLLTIRSIHPRDPNETISIFDLTSKTIRRVSPKTIDARAPIWLPGNKQILFSREYYEEGKGWQSDICIINVDGSNMNTVVRNGGSASYARQ